MSTSVLNAAEPSTRPLSFGRKLAYGVGDVGSNYSWTFVASFAMFYLTNFVGLSAATIGVLMLVARLLDGITDVLIGGLIDKTRSRMGKARPWLFWSTFPLAASQIMLFTVPAGLSETAKYAWFFVAYLLLGAFFYTASNISYNTLVSLITRDPKSRVALGSFRFISAIIAVIVLTSTTVALVDAFGGGQTGWTLVATLYAGVLVVFTMITVFGVRELADAQEQGVGDGVTAETPARPSLVRSLVILGRNRYFLTILAFFLVNYIASGVIGGAGIYFATYVLGNPAQLGLLSFAGMLPLVVALPIVPWLTARLTMRGACVAGSVVTLLGTGIALAWNGSLPVLLAGLIISALGQAPIVGAMYALVAEVAENCSLRSGLHMEGVVYSSASVGIKLGTGLGTAILGWSLAAGGFDGLAETQTPEAISAVSAIFLVIPLVLAVLRIPLMWLMSVEKDNARRRAGQEGAARETVALRDGVADAEGAGLTGAVTGAAPGVAAAPLTYEAATDDRMDHPR